MVFLATLYGREHWYFWTFGVGEGYYESYTMDSQEIKQIDNEQINSGLSFKTQMNRLKFSYFGQRFISLGKGLMLTKSKGA